MDFCWYRHGVINLINLLLLHKELEQHHFNYFNTLPLQLILVHHMDQRPLQLILDLVHHMDQRPLQLILDLVHHMDQRPLQLILDLVHHMDQRPLQLILDLVHHMDQLTHSAQQNLDLDPLPSHNWRAPQDHRILFNMTLSFLLILNPSLS